MSAKDARNELRNYNSVQEKPIDIICDVDVPLLLLSPPDFSFLTGFDQATT